MHTTTTGVPSTSIDNSRAAFDRTAADRAAVDPATVAQYNLAAVHAQAQALGVALRLAPYRARIAALPDSDASHLDKLPDYANALMFVHETLKTRAERTRQLPELAAEGFQLRAILLAYADLLVLQGVFDTKVIKRLREGAGYRDLVEDLNVLTRMFLNAPERIGPAAPVSTAQVERAKQVAETMTVQLGIDDERDLDHDTLVLERRKLAHLLTSAHRELRRAMDYIRFHEGDAAALVPSLYAPNKARSKPRATDARPADAPDDFAAMHDAFHEAHEPHLNPFVDA